MDKNELLAYIEENSDILTKFYDKAFAYQTAKNDDRPAARRWNERRVERATEDMLATFSANIYDKLNGALKGKSEEKWLEYIESYEILDQLSEAVIELEFE
ncbi:hypothetical protein [Ligilactobacillus faecis]|uniref:Phage protein n=1 Tax=Ligilactobacillus faecis TaxID=762833 RepID=A0ABV4DR37_9LACO|nr:hypothetical protein [Ligilactobacillus faecis]WGN89075.1 hypothetical protein QFX10_08475 [Ligilactobacillus faecis]